MFHKTGLKIEHHNIRGVRAKITELIEHINSKKPAIISLNKTFLKPKMKTPVIPGYTWTRNDRITGKQGVAFLIKDSITVDISENTIVKRKTLHETLPSNFSHQKIHLSTFRQYTVRKEHPLRLFS